MGENKALLLNLCIKASCLHICGATSTVCAASASLFASGKHFLDSLSAAGPEGEVGKKIALDSSEYLTRLLNTSGGLIPTLLVSFFLLKLITVIQPALIIMHAR